MDQQLQDLYIFCLENNIGTETQRAYVKAWIEKGSIRNAAKALDKNPRSLHRSVESLKKKAAQAGWLAVQTVPPGFVIKGHSTLADKDGNTILQWVKTRELDEDIIEQVKDAFSDLVDGIKPKRPTKASKTTKLEDELTVFPISDPHLGMYAWSKEAGEDWDTDKASETLIRAVTLLAENAKPTQHAAVINLGDFFHSDNLDNKTRKSGNTLDVDTRWPRVAKAGMDAMVACIETAMKKHETVTVYNIPGNHDDHGVIGLQLGLEAYFRNEPRVIVDMSPAIVQKIRFGKCLIGMTHGHTIRVPQLSGVMASYWPEDWGMTIHRHFLCGHIHHQTVREHHGCRVESFSTLAPSDAYHAGHGYKASRGMVRITYHKEYGEIGRETASIFRVKE